LIVAEPVTAIVREPEFGGVRVPVETDRVADPSGKDLDSFTICPDAQDRCIAF